ncbi:ribosomal protein S18-alanine N-acetyltransferase [candidate division WOR-3 bacterium]|nr:ribosomal protein S18-alanine N-acetyltransferase [candidate division WOR-3 bacterium]
MSSRDLDAVYALELELFPNPWPKAFFAADLRGRGTIAYVVEDHEKVLAYSMATCMDGKFHVTNIAVDVRYQRHGIASRLMNLLERTAVGNGCTYAYLEVRTNNEPAILLYKRLGYAIAYKRSHYYIDGDDAYVMEKELA